MEKKWKKKSTRFAFCLRCRSFTEHSLLRQPVAPLAWHPLPLALAHRLPHARRGAERPGGGQPRGMGEGEGGQVMFQVCLVN